MAYVDLTIADIIEHVRLAMGEPDATLSKVTDDQLMDMMDIYVLNLIARAKPKHFPYYRCIGTWTITFSGPGIATGSLPLDFDEFISFYDNDNDRFLPVVHNIRQFLPDWAELPRGAPRGVEFVGMTTSISGSSTYRQQTVKLWPTPQSAVTPSITVDYWRTPVALTRTGSTSDNRPDIPIAFRPLLIYGVLLDLLAPDDPAYATYRELHDSMLAAILSTVI